MLSLPSVEYAASEWCAEYLHADEFLPICWIRGGACGVHVATLLYPSLQICLLLTPAGGTMSGQLESLAGSSTDQLSLAASCGAYAASEWRRRRAVGSRGLAARRGPSVDSQELDLQAPVVERGSGRSGRTAGCTCVSRRAATLATWLPHRVCIG